MSPKNKKRVIAALLLASLAAVAGVFWVQANAENPEVVEQMQEDQQRQDDFEAFLNTLPPPSEGSE